MSIPTQAQMKERALFYLSRRVRELEDKVNIDHESLAKQGASYATRRALESQSVELAKEYEALEWMYNFVTEAKVKEIVWTPIPEYGDRLPIADFIGACKTGSFINSDGMGCYATEAAMSDVAAIPSDIECGLIKSEYTHVVWFNK